MAAARDVSLPGEVAGSPDLRRRRLLRAGFWTGVGVVAAGGLAALADFLNPRDIQAFGAVLTVPPDKVPRPGGEPYHDQTGKFWLVNLRSGEGVPEQFLRFAEPSRSGGLLALYERCTHLGTPVPWRPDFVFGGVTGWFRCPSHGATFTTGGIRVFGPAPWSMDTFPIVAVSISGVRVNTGHLLLGGDDDPQRTVPAGAFG